MNYLAAASGASNLTMAGPSSGSISRNMTSPRTGRRQSTVLMNLQFNDPSIPGPGEMANENHPISYRGSVASSPMSHASDPYRGRHPSLGELHQELEQEQEAHVVSPSTELILFVSC